VHIDTGDGMRITPNSVLAATSFTNLSRPPGAHKCAIVTTFSAADAPDKVCAMLTRVAGGLPLLTPETVPTTVHLGNAEYRTTVRLNSPADDGVTRSTFVRWVWYASRREELHLDGADDDFSTTERIQAALRSVVGPELRLSLSDQQSLGPYAKVVRYGTRKSSSEKALCPRDDVSDVRQRSPDYIERRRCGRTHNDAQQGRVPGVTTLTRQPSPAAHTRWKRSPRWNSIGTPRRDHRA